MTKHLTTENIFGRNAIGFDRLFDNLQYTARLDSSYPPYNIVREDENNYRIEMAIAGFTRNDITITHEKNVLTILGEVEEIAPEDGENYLHKGISSKRFTRQFTMGEHVVVSGAKMADGMLVIQCEQIVPKEKQPKVIKIS